MDSKKTIGKAIVDASEGRPQDFAEKMQQVAAEKLKDALGRAVAQKEEELFGKK